MVWLIGIAINLLMTGMFYDIAVRDIEIAVGAFALSQLSAVREEYGRAAENRSIVAVPEFTETR